MLDLQQIIEKLQDRNVAHIARIIGVSKAHLSAIKRGDAKPSYDVLVSLNLYFSVNK